MHKFPSSKTVPLLVKQIKLVSCVTDRHLLITIIIFFQKEFKLDWSHQTNKEKYLK